MKQLDAEAGGRKLLPSWGSRLVSASAVAALALIAASGAKADVIETFKLHGSFTVPSTVTFTGTIDFDFTDGFSSLPTIEAIAITVNGRPVFNESPSLKFALSGDPAVVDVSNSRGDTLALMFTTPNLNSFAGFNDGPIAGGEVIFGGTTGFTGFFFSPTGLVTADAPIPDPPAVPELSTWAMMLLGLAGLGLAARGRRAIGFLGGTV